MAENLSDSRKQIERSVEKLELKETELKNAHDKMEHKVIDRTRELQREIEQCKVKDQELQVLNKKLIEISRQAGMAEVATGILHNVGNVLNSVNVGTTILTDRIRTSKLSYLVEAVNLMAEHQDDIGEFMSRDPKGKQLPRFLSKVADYHTEEKAQWLQELDSLSKNVDHINIIISKQQSNATLSGLIEAIAVEELVQEAISSYAPLLEECNVELTRDFLDCPKVRIDKHQVLQVLENLIRNAVQALKDGNSSQKCLSISISQNDDRLAQIAVTDNGIGIEPGNFQKLFRQEFTYKKDGHGVGLHCGALAVKQMGGELRGHSDGINKGATFVMILPINEACAAKSSNVLLSNSNSHSVAV
jgi:signal transduction histidine kinase